MIEWMLYSFNYRAEYGFKNSEKSKDSSGLTNASFLKRVLNSFGMIDTPIFDAWEKILMGPEYSKCRNDRMVYLRRRLNDLCVFNSESREKLALYYAYCIHYPKMDKRVEQSMYRLLFTLTNGFTKPVHNRWEVFSKLFRVDQKSFLQKVRYYKKYIAQLYEKNFLTYDNSQEYVDYWKRGKESVTIRQFLSNNESIPLWYSKDTFSILHGRSRAKKRGKKRQHTRWKQKYIRSMKQSISF
jgi:hypothetical protein